MTEDRCVVSPAFATVVVLTCVPLASAQWTPYLDVGIDAGGLNDSSSFERQTSTGGEAISLFTNFSDTEDSNSWGGQAFGLGAGGEGGNYFRIRGSSSSTGADDGPRNHDQSDGNLILRDTLQFSSAGGSPLTRSIDVTFRSSWITNLQWQATNGQNLDPWSQANASLTLAVFDESGDIVSSVGTGQMGRSYRQFVNNTTDEVFITGSPGTETVDDTFTLSLDPGQSVGVLMTMGFEADPADGGVDAADEYFVSAFADNIFKLWIEEISASSPLPNGLQGEFAVTSAYGIDWTVENPVPAPGAYGVAVGALVLGSRRRRA